MFNRTFNVSLGKLCSENKVATNKQYHDINTQQEAQL